MPWPMESRRWLSLWAFVRVVQPYCRPWDLGQEARVLAGLGGLDGEARGQAGVGGEFRREPVLGGGFRIAGGPE